MANPKRNLTISHDAAFSHDILLYKLPVTSPPHRTALGISHSMNVPSHRRGNGVYMLVREARSSTSVFVTMSCQDMPRTRLRQRR